MGYWNVEKWPLSRKVGQRLMVGFDGTAMTPRLDFLIRELGVGGIIFFARNAASPEQIRDLCRAAQRCAADSGLPPLFIAIDQEGGQVARLKPPFTQFPGNPAVLQAADAVRFGRITAKELREVGINMNFAPVVDVAPAGMGSIMAGRSFGPDPVHVARMGVVVIETLQAGGVMAVAKHFPGIGRTRVDSHLDLPVMPCDREDIFGFDLPPFAAAMTCGVSGVMLSHILYPALDPQWPASLSPAIADGMIRRRHRYDGLVLTDDIDMGALEKHHALDTIVHQVVACGIDLVLICHDTPKIDDAAALMTALAKTESDAFEAPLRRIERAKARFLQSDFA